MVSKHSSYFLKHKFFTYSIKTKCKEHKSDMYQNWTQAPQGNPTNRYIRQQITTRAIPCKKVIFTIRIAPLGSNIQLKLHEK